MNDINEWFGWGRNSYFVLPRLAMQELPIEWQNKFIELMNEAESYGLVTPDYHVLRDEVGYTYVEPYDSEDPTSRNYEFTALREDPWANYRRGSVKDLCEGFKNEN